MIAFLVDMLSNIVGYLTGVLPRSPFSDLTLAQDVTRYLGWLNWVIPIRAMLAELSLVLAAYIAAKAAVTLVNGGIKAGSLVIGDK